MSVLENRLIRNIGDILINIFFISLIMLFICLFGRFLIYMTKKENSQRTEYHSEVYKGHHYLYFNNQPNNINGWVHDPDCPHNLVEKTSILLFNEKDQ